MTTLDEVGNREHWRCWLCDEPVDPDKSVNDARGPSIDNINTAGKNSKNGKGKPGQERLAHRACNTRKGAVTPVIPWPSRLFVLDPAPIIPVVERLGRKGGREVVARCPSLGDAQEAGSWLVDRLSRLAPDLPVSTTAEPGGGQFLLALRVDRAGSSRQ